MPQYKGYAVIKNAEGTLQFNGLATLTNDTNSITWEDATEIFQHRDAGNVLRTLTKDMNVFRLQVGFTPGVGSNLANQTAVKNAVAGIRKGMQFISGSFEDTDFIVPDADKAIVVDIRKRLAGGELMGIDVTLEKYTDTAGVVLNFPGAWADL